VLDVGAGRGAITRALLDVGASVVAVEMHPGRAAELRRIFRSCSVVVVQADASDLRLPRRPFLVVANPPFAIVTSLLRRLTSSGSRLERASLVLPTWVVARWTAGRGAGGLAARARYASRAGPRVPATAFRPPSPNDARVLLLEKSGADPLEPGRPRR
jgi:23S rRNA (adenine-N6)-dimethyltransferase